MEANFEQRVETDEWLTSLSELIYEDEHLDDVEILVDCE